MLLLQPSLRRPCFARRTKPTRPWRRPHVDIVVSKAAPDGGASLVFSEPLYPLQDAEDYYLVYREWNPDLERDLRQVYKRQLRLRPAKLAKLIRYSNEHSDCFTIFLNPGRLNARLQSYRMLEPEFPGMSIARILCMNPTVVTYSSAALRLKLQFLQDIFQGAPKFARAVSKCPTLLTRSITTLQSVHAFLVSKLGSDAAAVVIARYPELFSRSQATLEATYDAALAFLGVEPPALGKVLQQNPGLFAASDVEGKVLHLQQALGIDLEKAKLVAIACPTVLNLGEAVLSTKCELLRASLRAWDTDLAHLTPSLTARFLTASEVTLRRLEFAASGSKTRLSPSTLLMFKAADFDARFPGFRRWLRRKHGIRIEAL